MALAFSAEQYSFNFTASQNGAVEHSHPRNDDNITVNGNDEKAPNSFEPKIRQLLRDISSIELELYTEGCKEFMKLLRGSSGGELLCEYARLSAKFSELLETWCSRRGKVGVSLIMRLISVILDHPVGKYDKVSRDSGNDNVNDSICRVLDKFARVIVEQRMEDLVKELGSKDGKRQKVALLVLASLVRRGAGLADEVAKKFDFKVVPGFGKLAEYRRGKKVEKMGKRTGSTRGAFIEFAMSFLEVGRPGLLRSVLQQREVFSGILRGLGNDDDETVVYVLSTLRDRVLRQESGVAPALRSVLFGSVTLEQLVEISAREEDELAAKVAHEVLQMVCTDPSNGLMPDLKRKPVPLKGNHKRLVDMMKKLKAADVEYHRRLLLAIVKGRPTLASSYLDQFPYSLEDHSSSTWLSAVTLAANVVCSVRDGLQWDFLAEQFDNELTFENLDLQSLVQCVRLRPFSRLIANKGLLHSDPLIKHGTLRLLLEVLQLFSSLMDAMSPNRLCSLKRKLQDEVMVFLPDPQVLFTLISSIPTMYQKYGSDHKRKANSESISRHEATVQKKQKISNSNEDIDIFVPGLELSSESFPSEEIEKSNEAAVQIDDENGVGELFEIWVSNEILVAPDAEVYFHCKVLDALKLYHRTLHDVVDASYDVLKILPNAPLDLPSILMQSLLSMIIEHFECSAELSFSSKVLPPIYKHLQSFLVLFLHSSSRSIRQQAYLLAIAAMMSTGAFDHNACEIESWFLFLPGNVGPDDCCKYQDSNSFHSISMPAVSFLCEAVSTVGNNLSKHWGILKYRHSSLDTGKGEPVEFSPLVISVLEKCLRLVCSGSDRFKAENSLISLYVCSTLKYMLQTQVRAGVLASVVHRLLSEALENHIPSSAGIGSCFSEWRPLVSLMFFSRSIQFQETCNASSVCRVAQEADNSFVNALTVMKSLLTGGSILQVGMLRAVYFTIICSAPTDVVDNFPAVLAISEELPGFRRCIMSYFGVDHGIMKNISEAWPDMFYSGLKLSLLEFSPKCDKPTSDITPCTNLETIDYASVFGSLLKEAPFHILFPGFVFWNQEHCSEIKELLLAKVSNLASEQIICSLRLILFWFHQIHLSYGHLLSEQQEWYSEICYTLVERILLQISKIKVDSGSFATSAATSLSLCIQEVAKTVFVHPVVTATLSHPCSHEFEFTEEFLKGISNGQLDFNRERICKTELHVLKLLTTASDYLFALCSREKSSAMHTDCKEQTAIAFKNLVMQIVLIFKDNFFLWYQNLSLLPILSIVLSLARFISPIDLLELADWIFAQVDLSKSMIPATSVVSPTSLALSVACVAFDLLFQQLQSVNIKGVLSDLFWVMRMKDVYASVSRSIYLKAFESATTLNNDIAYTCLLKALVVARCLTYRQDLSHVSMEVCRVIACTPLEIVSYCVLGTNNTKAKILCFLIEISPLHGAVFGNLLSGMMSNDYAQKSTSVAETKNQCLSDEEYLCLLPAAVSYNNHSQGKLGERSFKRTELIPAFYSKLFMDGFINQKDFVSGAVFKVEYGDSLRGSVKEFHGLFSSSFLGKAVDVLQTYFTTREDDVYNRLDVVRAVLPCSDEIQSCFNVDVSDSDSCSFELLLNRVNRTVAKISICMLLMFPNDCKKCPCDSDEERVKFFDMLVCFWQQIVEKFPFPDDDMDQEAPIYLLFRSLEFFILRSLHRLSLAMHDVLSPKHLASFVKKVVKASLRHRFGDPTTLEILRHILSSVSNAKLLVKILQQFLGHSQLAVAVTTARSLSGSNVSGVAVRPISSFLKSLIVPPEINLRKPERDRSCLEVFKLLRLLFHLIGRQHDTNSEGGLGVNSRELVVLLLSSYGATVGDMDREIYGLLSEIESAAKGQRLLADLDYLWGNSIGLFQERVLGRALINSDMEEEEQERRRSQFRDNFPVDNELLIKTILYFPYEMTSGKSLFLDNGHEDNEKHFMEGQQEMGRFELYDPAFLLSFSIHSLTMSYLNTLEFAGLGLLAVAFMSIASPCDGIRKLGYEVIERFKDALKRSPRKKEVKMFERLLPRAQNDEQWQKVPTVFAAFAAEASVVILDSSHEHYKTVSEFLLRFSWTNLENTTIFHDACWSGFVNSKSDRLWMLRLLYAGINTEDDAHIFIRNAVPEILLRFYASSFSDFESKEMILQVVKKCVKVRTMSRHLIEKCCLISWLSSVLGFCTSVTKDDDRFLSTQLMILLEVVHEIVSSGSTAEWLQNYALEQLSSLSCHLVNLLVTRSKLGRDNLPSAISILKVMMSTLEISQKRNAQQPHYTLSMRILFQLYEAVDAVDSDTLGGCAELALKTILMSMPPSTVDLDLEELPKFLIWAVSTALHLDSRQAVQKAELSSSLDICAGNNMLEDSLSAALLRWIVAFVVQQGVSCRLGESSPNSVPPNESEETLLSFMECLKSEASKVISGYEEILAATIFYLQQLAALRSRVLPSSVAALSILLLSDECNHPGGIACDASSVTSSWSKIRYPPEAKPSWKWSFQQPCTDATEGCASFDTTNEFQACQNVLVKILEVLEHKSLDFLLLNPCELESSGLPKWERTVLPE